MKVKFNGYEIECTPQEFMELTGSQGKADKALDEIQKLPDNYKLPDDYDRWLKHPDVVALYGCQVWEPVKFTPGLTNITYSGESSLSAIKEYTSSENTTKPEPMKPIEFPSISINLE